MAARKSAAALTLLVVDDHEIVRVGLRTVLDVMPGIAVVGEAATAAQAVAEAERLRPDVVLMDIRLPDGSGVEACRQILSALPQTRVLFLTSYADDDTLLDAVMAGAQGYVVKDSSNKALLDAIETVAAGKSLLDPQITARALSFIRTRFGAGTRPKTPSLSPQEERVLKLVAEGKTNKEIAAALHLSDKTVKNYLANIYDKLHVSRRSQATAVYLKALR